MEHIVSPDEAGWKLLRVLRGAMGLSGSAVQGAKWEERILLDGIPAHTHLVCPISSVYAVEYLQKHLMTDSITLWTAAMDEELTSHSYIVPGLGDAGDLAFGEKL